jgi:hypothetical protein
VPYIPLPPPLAPHIPPLSPSKEGLRYLCEGFPKKNFQVFFSKISDPLCIPPSWVIPSGKHDPLFISKPFFKKISGEFFILKILTNFVIWEQIGVKNLI